MPPPVKVLIIDDSVVVRRLLTAILSEESDIEVVGSASNGRLGLARIPQVNPDIIVLDVEMPEMDGLETLRELRKTYRTLPVIMFSTLTERGATATLDALSLGANDYVTKPSNTGSLERSADHIRGELVPRVRQLGGRRRGAVTTPPLRAPAPERPGARPAAGSVTPLRPATERGAPAGAKGRKPPAGAEPAPRRARSAAPAEKADRAGSAATAALSSGPVVLRPAAAGNRRIDVVAIGVSTGGPNALAVVLPKLPGDLPVPVVIVQHMPPLFTRLLAERLDRTCALHIEEGVPGTVLRPGGVWIAPGDYHMLVKRRGAEVVLETNQEPPENSCRPAVDVLFRSVVGVYGSAALGVIMTGMGQDGLKGCQQLVDAGGSVLAQDEDTSVVWGMPGYVARAGLAEAVLPLDRIAEEIDLRARRGRAGASHMLEGVGVRREAKR